MSKNIIVLQGSHSTGKISSQKSICIMCQLKMAEKHTFNSDNATSAVSATIHIILRSNNEDPIIEEKGEIKRDEFSETQKLLSQDSIPQNESAAKGNENEYVIKQLPLVFSKFTHRFSCYSQVYTYVRYQCLLVPQILRQFNWILTLSYENINAKRLSGKLIHCDKMKVFHKVSLRPATYNIPVPLSRVTCIDSLGLEALLCELKPPTKNCTF